MRSHRLLFLAFGPLALALALWAGVRGEGPNLMPTAGAQDARPAAVLQSRLEARRTATVRAVDRVRGAVVNIHSERTIHNPSAEMFSLAPSQNRINGMGTGIIIDQRGYIVTNQHVVEDVSVIRIRLADGTSLNAAVLARSAEVDLALLKIDVNRPLQTVPLGTASDLMVGEKVIAIGNAYGYEHTVSEGIVSAVKRDVNLNKEISYRSLIQTDAAINPGNSGGPLLNIHGELVGINVAIRAGAQGIGFAIPVDTMIRVVSDMLRTRRQQSVVDGLSCRDRLEAGADGLVRTVLVERADATSPAGTAGLRKGDQLVKVGDVAVACCYDVDRALMDRRPGEHVAVVFRRGGKDIPTDLVLMPAGDQKPGAAELVWRKLGVRLVPVSPDQVGRINRQLNGGMEVVAVVPEGTAGKAGIRKGDVLVGLHQWETLSLDNVAFVLMHPDLPSFNPLSFYILRTGQVRRGWLQQVE